MVSITYKIGWNDTVNGFTSDVKFNTQYAQLVIEASKTIKSKYQLGATHCAKRYLLTLNQPNKLPYND